MTKRRRKKRTRTRSVKPKNLQYIEYEVTSEPIEDNHYKKLPQDIKDAIEQLHHDAQKHPAKAIPELLDWIEKYPNVPMLYNYLSVAYNMSGQLEKAEEAIYENYQRNPDYLFARLNYAEVQRHKGNYEKIAEILENKFDLKLLYPNRNKFHISEVVNFSGIVGLYFLGIGDRDTAKKYYNILEQLDPDHQTTKVLKQSLYPNPVQKMLRRLANKSKKG